MANKNRSVLLDEGEQVEIKDENGTLFKLSYDAHVVGGTVVVALTVRDYNGQELTVAETSV